MGAVCCCLHAQEYEDYLNSENPAYRNCTCVRCVLHNLANLSASFFRSGEVYSAHSPIRTSNFGTSSHDSSLPDMYHAPPRPLPYEVEPRLYNVHREGLVSRREKGSTHFDEETEPLRVENDPDQDTTNKWNSASCEEEVKEINSKSSLKLVSSKSLSRFGYFGSIEEEDFCPTCLEEYTVENPKIVTNCSHHFHLGCIYEWMERSDSCPVCGKVMAFKEPT